MASIFELTKLKNGSMQLLHREIFKGVLVPLLWKKLNTQTRVGFEGINAALKHRAEQSSI